MKLTLPILAISATMFASSASAFDPDDLQKLLDTNVCAQCDLRGASMTGANLRRATLEGADLRDANLEGASLEGGNLEGALMKGAILCNTTTPDGSVIYSGC